MLLLLLEVLLLDIVPSGLSIAGVTIVTVGVCFLTLKCQGPRRFRQRVLSENGDLKFDLTDITDASARSGHVVITFDHATL
jgi:hypothetical protein